MAIIDPKQHMSAAQKQRIKNPPKPLVKLSPGRRVMQPVGFAYKEVRGNKILEVCSVCIYDIDKKGEEGCLFIDSFNLIEAAQWRIINWVIAQQYTDTFDPEKASDIQKIIDKGSFQAVFTREKYNEKEYMKIKFHNISYQSRDKDGDPIYTKEEDALISRAEDQWKIWVLKRANDDFRKYGNYDPKTLPLLSTGKDNESDGFGEELPF